MHMERTAPVWLLLAYSLPKEPSRYRVSVWRRLRKLGAIYLSEGFWVLPNLDSLKPDLESVIKEVQSSGGTASAFVSSDFDPEQAGRLEARFLDARNEEYSELQGQQAKFLLHVEHAHSTRRYTFAEVEELEEELAKLEHWLAEIRERDVFRSPEYEKTALSLGEARKLLESFTEVTYAEVGEKPPSDLAPGH